MAEPYYAQLAPHLYCGPVEGAANAQLAACIPNFLILESIERWDGFHGEIVTGMKWQDGYVIPSREPGLGIGPGSAIIGRPEPRQPWPMSRKPTAWSA